MSSEKLHIVEPDQLDRLQDICVRLHAGDDRMRDEGNRLMLVIDAIKVNRVSDDAAEDLGWSL